MKKLPVIGITLTPCQPLDGSSCNYCAAYGDEVIKPLMQLKGNHPQCNLVTRICARCRKQLYEQLVGLQ